MKLLFISTVISILNMLPVSACVASDMQNAARVHQSSAAVPHARSPLPSTSQANQIPGLIGMASFYGKKFQGRYTANGEQFDKNEFTAAHPSLPFGTKVKVTNLRNKRSVVVKVNDRGGFNKHGRIIDVSRAAASALGMVRRGVARVKLEVMK